MAHDITYFTGGHDHYYYRCRCGATCGSVKTRQMAEDEAGKHLDLIARIRKPRSTTLEAEHRHALDMAQDINVPRADRDLWQQMANELGKRLGLDAPPSEQGELFAPAHLRRSTPP